jgi:hypothetical protein
MNPKPISTLRADPVKHFLIRGPEAITPVIPATQKAEIRRTSVRSQPRQIVHETLSLKQIFTKRAGGVTQGEGPEFKSQHQEKKKKVLSTGYCGMYL